jgi:hypothetical protein
MHVEFTYFSSFFYFPFVLYVSARYVTVHVCLSAVCVVLRSEGNPVTVTVQCSNVVYANSCVKTKLKMCVTSTQELNVTDGGIIVACELKV